jgi:hypothetical protein
VQRLPDKVTSPLLPSSSPANRQQRRFTGTRLANQGDGLRV